MLAAGLAIQSAAVGEELCLHCAQKDIKPHAQKFANGARGYSKGVSQKGHEQKGHAQKGKGGSHGCQHKEHSWFYSHHPPAAPILESAAVMRVPVPQQVNFRIQRESGRLRPESAPAPESAAVASDINARLTNLEKHVSRLYESLDKLVTQLQDDQSKEND